MESKRTKQICVRVSEETYNNIKATAEKQRWTIAQTTNIILEQFYKDKNEIRI